MYFRNMPLKRCARRAFPYKLNTPTFSILKPNVSEQQFSELAQNSLNKRHFLSWHGQNPALLTVPHSQIMYSQHSMRTPAQNSSECPHRLCRKNEIKLQIKLEILCSRSAQQNIFSCMFNSKRIFLKLILFLN